jgi:hypothetical protein
MTYFVLDCTIVLQTGNPHIYWLPSYNRLHGTLKETASERQLLLLETSMHFILPSFQIHLATAFSYTRKIKIAWQVVNVIMIHQIQVRLLVTVLYTH